MNRLCPGSKHTCQAGQWAGQAQRACSPHTRVCAQAYACHACTAWPQTPVRACCCHPSTTAHAAAPMHVHAHAASTHACTLACRHCNTSAACAMNTLKFSSNAFQPTQLLLGPKSAAPACTKSHSRSLLLSVHSQPSFQRPTQHHIPSHAKKQPDNKTDDANHRQPPPRERPSETCGPPFTRLSSNQHTEPEQGQTVHAA
jgi:hypothetical protein